MADMEQPAIETIDEELEMDIEGEEEEYDEEDYDDDEAEEEVDAVVQKLGAALWEDINKVYAQQGVQLQASGDTVATSPALSEGQTDEETLLSAVQTVLEFSDLNSSFHQLLSETIVSGPEANTLYDVLVELVGSGTIAPDQAMALSDIVQAIATGNTLVTEEGLE